MIGRLFGSVDLLLFSEDITKFTSCACVGAMNNNPSLGWWQKYWNNLFENLTFVSYYTM